MNFYSTADKRHKATLREAVISGIPPVGGLYMPEHLEPLPASFYEAAADAPFCEVAMSMGRALLGEDLPEGVLERIVRESFDFEVPLIRLDDRTFVLELFHGPTLAFKDFAARFMARLMGHFVAGEVRELHVLVATSGDTGSAVAHGFHGIPGIRVHILFPAGRVSAIQEAQLTRVGGNVSTLEVDGSFDDCQRLVKTAFLDADVRSRLMTSSANSMNIARLVPQSFYYCWAWSRLSERSRPVVFSVPSGNFGNLTAGLIAKRLGLPVSRFIAATNANDVVPVFLDTGVWMERPVKATISNAMDVSRPSNWERIVDLYGGDREAIRKDVQGHAFDDDHTRAAIRELNRRFRYIADPHGAVGWLGLEKHRQVLQDFAGIFLETAHPAKFPDVVSSETGTHLDLPARLSEILSGPRRFIAIGARYPVFKEYLMNL